jgi:hypothetical protein
MTRDGRKSRLAGVVLLALAERIGEEAAGIGAPGGFRLSQPFERFGVGVQLLDRGRERLATRWRVEITGELEHGRVVQRRLALETAAGSEHQQGAPDCRVPVGVVEGNLQSRDVCEDDEIDVASRSGTRLRSSRA